VKGEGKSNEEGISRNWKGKKGRRGGKVERNKKWNVGNKEGKEEMRRLARGLRGEMIGGSDE
jgi:hypothetical protein